MPKYTMSDAREFTNYNTNTVLDKLLQEKYGVKNSHEYRQFLQKNAKQVMMNDLIKRESECEVCPVCKQNLPK